MAEKHNKRGSHCGYHSGHPWYYLLGGKVLTPKEIRDCVAAGTYRGYRADDIRTLAKKPEPQRSTAIRKIRAQVTDELKADIARYRQYVFALHAHRRTTDGLETPRSCDDIHTAVSLKHNHIVNGFAHLALLNELPAQQGDLFAL